MANLMKAVPKSVTALPLLEGSGPVDSIADPEVAEIARRRNVAPAEKRRILALADKCTEPGEVGALLRREGIYSSQLSAWRKQRAAKGTAGVGSPKRGRQADPAIAEAHRIAKLNREIERLQRQLAQARLIIDVQKKVSSLLALQTEDDSEGKS